MVEKKKRKTLRRENGSQHDLISELPQGVIETILVKLPIIDAVRTSILSRRWRYQWASMPDIVFDDDIAERYGENDAQINIVKFITTLLFLHEGPIRKFSLSSSYIQSMSESDICQWLLFVSRKDVKELVIGIELIGEQFLKVPSCLFSCMKLTRLDLFRCILYPPHNFEGFPCLKSLSLREVLVSQDELESLISSSHLLDDLTLLQIKIMDIIDDVYLTVCAPNLKKLVLEGFFMELILANTPILVDLSIALEMDDDMLRHFKNSKFCYYERILDRVPNLERLECREYFTAYMSWQIDFLQHRPIVFPHLKSLELYDVDFFKAKEVLVAVQIITNCPNLHDLQISGFSGHYDDESGILNSSDWVEAELRNLKTVKFTKLNAATYEMKFIKYLLERSPALQKMRISPRPVLSTDTKLKTVIELMAFRRASTIASVVFCDGTGNNPPVED